MSERADLAAFAAIDARLVAVGRDVRVLGGLTWPSDALEAFLADWQAGNPRLPRIEPSQVDMSGAIRELTSIMDDCDRTHPVGAFLHRSARSCRLAAEMLGCAGEAAFTARSIELYGAPSDPIGPTGVTNLEVADHFLTMTEDLIEAAYVPDDAYVLTPAYVAELLRARIAPVFTDHPIEVVIDPRMASKAAAGSRRVRIRGATGFTPGDVDQLVEHELFVHSLTALNGREQAALRTLGVGTPRTTATQEGLATFAEVITGTMDLGRLRRLALRVRAVAMALDGADFLDVFRYFHTSGQNLQESFHSAMRVFRGGDVRGRLAFTKDVVYVQGLVHVHAFLLKAIQAGRPELVHHLFAGRMTLGDALALDPWFRSGALAPPLYEPPWVKNRATLASFLIYSVFNTRLELGGMNLSDFIEPEADAG